MRGLCNWANWFRFFNPPSPNERSPVHGMATRRVCRDNRGFTLVEMLLVLTLLGIVTAAVSNWTLPFLKQEARYQNELLLQSESLLFFHDLARELRSAESLEIRNRMLYASVPEPAEPDTLTEEAVSYQYYLDSEGRFIRRVWRKDRYEGYTIMLQHIQTLQMEIQEDGSLRITGTTERNGAVHSFAWTMMPRLGWEQPWHPAKVNGEAF